MTPNEQLKLIETEMAEYGPDIFNKNHFEWLVARVKRLTEALNTIGILQMGDLDYTKDFFEQTKQIVRSTLQDE